MGKKGAKRKTRWRTLSIGTPPGEEDEEEGKHNGYLKHGQDRGGSGRDQQQRSGSNGYASWHKSRHGSAGSSGSGGAGSGGGGNGNGSTTSGYASSRSRNGRDDCCSDSPTHHRSNHNHNGGPPGSHHHHHHHHHRIVFNEEEYTRITTPRQDMLFKKGYLTQRKPWTTSTTSMSATPSTNDSQSASHSTADGSEAAEDQQLLDSGVLGEYAGAVGPAPGTTSMVDPASIGAVPTGHHLAYSPTYYDHATGAYYYEYQPMMLVPAPGPALVEQPPMLAAMPCASLPLRPIEWVNPAYVPKLASQQYCYMNYQPAHSTDCAALVDAQGVPMSMVEPAATLPLTNGFCNKSTSLTGSSPVTSTNGSTTGDLSAAAEEFQSPDQPQLQQYSLTNEVMVPETLEITEPSRLAQEQELIQQQQQQPELIQEQGVILQEQPVVQQVQHQLPVPETLEVLEPVLETIEYPEAAYVETLPPQPLHHVAAHHVIPQTCGQSCGQSYIYPGQYMFGPPVVNVNGMTVQSGPMLRCSDVVTNPVAPIVKRKKKKKRRKLKRPITFVSETYPFPMGSVEDDDEEDYYSSEENSQSSPRTTVWPSPLTNSMPLNPECQEFHLTPTVIPSSMLSEASVSSPEFYPRSYTSSAYTSLPAETTNGVASVTAVKKSELRYDESTVEFVPKASQAITLNNNHAADNEEKRLTNEESSKAPALNNHEDVINKSCEKINATVNEALVNGDCQNNTEENGCLVNGDQEDKEEVVQVKLESCVNRISNGLAAPSPDLDSNLDKNLDSNEDLTILCTKNSKDSRSIEDLTIRLNNTTIIETEVSQKSADLGFMDFNPTVCSKRVLKHTHLSVCMENQQVVN